MSGSLNEIQQLAQQLVPILLLAPGVVLVAMGLFYWLGGLRFLGTIGAFSGAIAGGVCAWMFTNRELVPMVLFPVITAALGLFFKKPMVVCLGAILAGLIILSIPAIVNMPAQIEQQHTRWTQQEKMNLLDSIQQIEQKVKEIAQEVRDYYAGVPKNRITVAAMASIGVLGVGFVFTRLVCAVTCSIIGTCLIGVGMLLLLLFKGAQPFDLIAQRGPLLMFIVIVMIAFGTIIDLWLSPKKKKKKEMVKDVLNEGNGK